MDHLSDEQLAALAVDPTHEPGSDELDHLGSCPSCRDRAAELTDLARDLRTVRPDELRPPRPTVWSGIERELAADEPAPSPVSPIRRPGRPRRAAVVVAAVSGLVVGAGGTLGVLALRPTDTPALVASTVLAPLPGETGAGTAELVRDHDALRLRVHAELGASPTPDHREVWLINGDGRRMWALGVLPSSGDASYWLPAPSGQGLDGYRTVDISLEPDDGDTGHSQHSLVRGELPG